VRRDEWGSAAAPAGHRHRRGPRAREARGGQGRAAWPARRDRGRGRIGQPDHGIPDGRGRTWRHDGDRRRPGSRGHRGLRRDREPVLPRRHRPAGGERGWQAGQPGGPADRVRPRHPLRRAARGRRAPGGPCPQANRERDLAVSGSFNAAFLASAGPAAQDQWRGHAEPQPVREDQEPHARTANWSGQFSSA